MRSRSYSYAAILFGAVGITLIMLILIAGGLWLTRPATKKLNNDPSIIKTAIFTIIPASSATASQTSTVVESTTVSPDDAPSLAPGELSLGTYVQIVGTQGDGLRLREEPGLGNTVLTLVSDAEVFKVLEGPQAADGHTWWYLSDPYNETRRGWAVANYLSVLQNP